jgi:hypothetical protein
MKKVVLNLQNTPIPQKVQKGRQVANQIDGNGNFATPDPSVAAINSTCDGLETAYNDAEEARQIAKEKTAAQNVAEDKYDNIMNQVGNYVENASAGDPVKIMSAGLDVKSDGVSSDALLPKPANISASTGDMPKTIDLHWDKVEGASSYNVYMSTDPTDAANYDFNKSSTKSSAGIGGLTSGVRYYFRVTALNTNGESAPSETANKVAP